MQTRLWLIAALASLPTAARAQAPATPTAPAAPAAPAATPPAAPETDAEGDTEPTAVGIDPGQPEYGGEVAEGPAGANDTARAADGGNHFEVHGYLRAPLRASIGSRNDGTPGRELHAPAHVPDGSFSDWRYLDSLPGPWSELFFSYGGARAKATVSIASYNQTLAGYRELQAQLGINQAFVTLNFPNAFGRYGELSLTAGSFSNRYGTAGKNDAGMYETYLFGRTRAAGETLSARIDVARNFAILAEHGVGAKLDVTPFDTLNPRPDYLPYPGPVPQGSTFLHHAHLGVELLRRLLVTGHYLTTWTPDDNAAVGQTSKPGRMTVLGGEAKIKGGAAGDGYVGVSYVRAKDILPLADALELLHSAGGSQFKNNFFGRFDAHTGAKPPDDTGAVTSVLFQYSLSVGGLARYPAHFSGNGPDLNVTLFGMFNSVDSQNFAHQMLKYGGELLYSPLEILAVGVRGDLVQPNLSNREQSFAVLSPKLVLRTSFLAHERVTLQYSHYWNGSAAYAAFPYDRLPKADKDALMLSASMWW